jgi:hypothetical protein
MLQTEDVIDKFIMLFFAGNLWWYHSFVPVTVYQVLSH